MKFVRLTLMEPMDEDHGDSGELFIDFSELEVFGGPGNVLPRAPEGPAGPTVNQPFTLTRIHGSGQRIAGYDWDLDGNGSVDRSTVEPTTTTTYATPGTFSPKVFAKIRGSSGSASAGVLVTSGAAPPPTSERPTLALPRSGTKGRARFRVTCDSACLGNAKVTISRATARKLKLRLRTVGTKRFLFSRARTASVTIKLSRSVMRKMRRARMRTLTIRLRVSATDLEGQRRSASRTVRIRRN